MPTTTATFVVDDRAGRSASDAVHLLTFPTGIPSDLDDIRFEHSPETGVVAGVGQQHSYEGRPCKNGPASKFVIGLFSPSTLNVELDVLPAPSLPMELVVATPSVVAGESSAPGTYAQTSRVLIKEFGSTKRRRTMEAFERNNVNVAVAGSAGALSQAVSAGAALPQDQPGSLPTRSYLPPFDATTDDRRQIYPIAQLITPHLLSDLPIDSLVDRDQIQFAFVLGCTEVRRRGRDERRLLVLLSFMMDLYLKNMERFKSSSSLAMSLGCSDALADYFLATFRQSRSLDSGRVVFVADGAMIVKLLCHICVVALTVLDFSISKVAADQLQGDLRITSEQMYSHFRQLGAIVRRAPSAGDNYVAISLSAPISFPSAPKAQRNR